MDLFDAALTAGATYFGGPAAGAAVAGYLGTQDTNANQAAIAEQTNKLSTEEAQCNRDFQERMSNSAYQRQVADLEAAGLNPMLAYVKGGGASSPSGSQASFTSAQYQSPVQGALQGRLTSAQSAKTEAEKLKTEAQTVLTEAESKKAEAAADEIRARIDQIKGDTNFDVQQDRLKQTAWMLHQQGVKYQEDGMTAGQQRAVMTETINLLQKQGELLKLDLDAAKKFDNFAREYKQYAPIVDLMKAILLPRSGGITINK